MNKLPVVNFVGKKKIKFEHPEFGPMLVNSKKSSDCTMWHFTKTSGALLYGDQIKLILYNIVRLFTV